MRKILCAALAVLLLTGSGKRDRILYKDASAPVANRVADLLSRMTLDEKIGQLICPYGWPMYDRLSLSEATYNRNFVDFIQKEHGGMLWGLFRADPWTKKTLDNGLFPQAAISAYNSLQRYAIDSTRLGIPILLAEEAPHGHMAIGTTVMPTSLGLAASWDEEAMEEVGRTVAEELCAVGARIAYGPVVDLARELRWSRVEETYGEDPSLTARLAGSFVRGLSPKKNGWDRGVVATLKHFTAYGAPLGGHNGHVSVIGERDIYENVLPVFKACLDEGALSVMTSYNSINGIPCTANEDLLSGLLRDQWSFDGIVVSDLGSIDGLRGTHRIAKDNAEAGKIALEAGVDVDLGARCYSQIKALVESGEISQIVLDRAVSRVLTLKFSLGLFDHPYLDPARVSGVRSHAHGEVALKMAREGVVLLENRGILPLDKGMKVAVIGPNADMMYNQLGDYTAPQQEENICTPLEGIREKIGADRVVYEKGCAIRDTQWNRIEDAARVAREADVAVVFVGGSSARDFETRYIETGAAQVNEQSVSDMESGEGYDRATLTLLGLQEELLKAVKATGTPIVVVYIEGRPLDKSWAKDHADALLTQFYPGQAGGQAIADVLFGDYNPAGRLPVSVPRSVGQLPVYYNQPFPGGGNYIDSPGTPLYAFGYGLSYTTFSYDDVHFLLDGNEVRVSDAPSPRGRGVGGNRPQGFPGGAVPQPTRDTVAFSGPDSRMEVQVTLTNTGSVDGDEVVQLYLTDMLASTVRPRQQLRAFRRVHVKAGETVRVSLLLAPDDFGLYDRKMEHVVEAGDFTLRIGPSSDSAKLSKILSLKGMKL